MTNPEEKVGQTFSVERLHLARERTLEVIEEVGAALRPGMLESEARELVRLAQIRRGIESVWHPPQIRFGENTLLSYGKRGETDRELDSNDICFIDLGPVSDGYEGDVGRTFAFGNDPDHRGCVQAVETIWRDTAEHWRTEKVSGSALYAFAEARARALGWVLTREHADGHRIGDFPHSAFHRGSVGDFTRTPASERWILEIQIRHPVRPFGAFYEDLLA